MSQPLMHALDAFQHFQPLFSWNQEELHIVALNANKVPIATALLFRGTADFCLFHPRDVFRFVMQSNATSFILAHNHPSGDPTPSFADLQITKKLLQASKLFGVVFTDHLVITPERFVSLKEMGVFMNRRKRQFEAC